MHRERWPKGGPTRGYRNTRVWMLFFRLCRRQMILALKHIVCVTSNSVDRRQKLTEMAALSPDDDRDHIMPPISELALIYINDQTIANTACCCTSAAASRTLLRHSSRFRRMRSEFGKIISSSRQARQFFPASLTKIAEKVHRAGMREIAHFRERAIGCQIGFDNPFHRQLGCIHNRTG